MILEIIWSLISFGGLLRALMLVREAIIDRRALAPNANGARLLANWQVEHAWLGVLIYVFLFGAGGSALFYRLDVIPLHYRLLVASGCLVLALFVLVYRQERDASYRKKTMEGEAVQKRSLAKDTNARVREIQARGLHDRPLEETDRAEGKLHRYPKNE